MGRWTRFIFATPNNMRDRLNMRVWFAGFCVYLGTAALMSAWGFEAYTRTGSPAGRALWMMGLYVFYLSLACTFVPLPTSWFVLLLASPAGGLGIPVVGRIVVLAVVGAFATSVSHVNEYHVISWLLRLGKIRRLQETRAYQWAERVFTVSPFLLQVMFNVAPVPADPVRWMATIYGYPLGKFFLAHWLGRVIRYSVLAVLAVIFRLTVRQIMVIQAGLVILALSNVVWHRVRTSNATDDSMER